MKKTLLSLIFLLAGITVAFAQFTPGNLAIYRYGDGTPMVNGAFVPVFIDEYTPAGVFVKTIAVPTAANGASYGLKGLGRKADGTYESEGYPVLSRDGSILSIIGYNPSVAGEFVIGTISATGNVNTTTLVDATDAIGTPRSAVLEGTAVYFNGYQNGVRYKQWATITPSIRVSSSQAAPRVLTIAASTFGPSATLATRIFAPIGTGNSLASNVLTTTTNTVFETAKPNVPNFPGTGAMVNPHQAVVFKSLTGRTVIYMLDDNAGSPVIRKYRTNSNAEDWVALGTVSVAVGTKSLTGTYSAAGAILYFTTVGTPGVTGSSQLFTITDVFTTATEANVTFAGTPTLLASAAADVTFRGVTLAPTGTSILPVSLTSFTGKATTNGAQLAWQTASEYNNDHFEVLKAVEGSEFKTIGTVKGDDNSTVAKNYTFLDQNTAAGTNYYQLKQVDKDGTAILHKEIVSVKVAFGKTDFTVAFVAEKQEIEITVNALAADNGTLKIYNTSGKVVASKAITLNAGFNKFTFATNNIANGVYIANINFGNQTLSKKFIK